MTSPAQLSRELRQGQSADLTNRRWVVGLSLVGVAMGQIVSLYQTGIIKHLPDPPIGPFDSDKVDASNYAYSRLQTPDALTMIVNYGITAGLAGAGAMNRAETTPWLPIAAALKVLIDAGTTVELGREEWNENKKLCAYCQLATLVSLASVAFVLPEALKAVQNLRGRR